MYAIELSFKDLIMSFGGFLAEFIGSFLSPRGDGSFYYDPNKKAKEAKKERKKLRYKRGQEQTDGAGTDGISDVLGG